VHDPPRYGCAVSEGGTARSGGERGAPSSEPKHRGPSLVAPEGELDAHTYEAFRDELLAVRSGDVVVDLSRVTFVDSMTLGAIVQASKRATERGDRLTVVVPDSHIRKVIEVTGLGKMLRLTRSLDDVSR
jgi:anti-sigma B factor antagonist